MMDEVSATVRAYLARRKISQSSLAREANVSQATVSRALAGRGQRVGVAQARLFTYIHSSPSKPQRAIDAVQQVWDGSTAHEDALAVLIRASGDLWPKLRKE
jgi:transcriptional regulator with XRE-family HTH domain